MVFKKGYKQTEEHRRRIKESVIKEHKSNPNYAMKGKKHSEETKQKMSLSKKGKPHSKEHVKNWLDSMNELRSSGKLITWNKGLTPRKGKYAGNSYKSHRVWCTSNGFSHVPSGTIIHHLDLNPKNNVPKNLIMMDKETHRNLHVEICKGLRDMQR